MSYDPSVPASGQSLGSSRPTIQGNFASLQTTIDQNHVDMNEANAGKHNIVEFLQQASTPSTPGDVLSMYSKVISGALELFLRKAGDGTDIQMTKGPITIAASGTTFLPGGLQLNWGQVVPGASPTSVSWVNNFPNNVFAVVLTINNDNPNFSCTTDTVDLGGFQLYTTKTGVTHFYMAIGN